jgi:Domain of unknown function (DUF5658)
MGALAKSIVLFALNWVDAQLTLFWVHSRLATEGNGLMSELLKAGDAPFLLVKVAIGAFAAYTLYRCSHLPLARRGMQLVLTVYVALMMVHAATGMSALGWSRPGAMISYVTSLPYALLTLFS